MYHKYMVWKYEQFHPWFKQNKNRPFFKFIEKCPLFPWYGKRVIYVKAKDPSTLSDPQRAVKDAIQEKNYKKALDIVNSIPQTKQVIALKQIIETKLTASK